MTPKIGVRQRSRSFDRDLSNRGRGGEERKLEARQTRKNSMVWKWALPQLQFQFNRNRTSWYLYSLDPFLCLFRGVNRIPRVPAWNSPVPRKAGKGESSTGRDRNSNDNDSSRQSRCNNGSERRSFFHSMKRRRGRRVGRARAREREKRKMGHRDRQSAHVITKCPRLEP